MSAMDHALLLERILRMPDVRELRLTETAAGVTVGIQFMSEGSGASFTQPHLCAAVSVAFNELRDNRQRRIAALKVDLDVLDGVETQPEGDEP